MRIRTCCPRCSASLIVDRAFAYGKVACARCGAVFTARPEDDPPWPRPRDVRDSYSRPRRRRRKPDDSSWAIASLLLGIASSVVFCLWPLGLMAGTAGLALGSRGLASRSRKLAIVGLVFSMVGLTYSTGVGVTMIVAIAAAPTTEDDEEPFWLKGNRPGGRP